MQVYVHIGFPKTGTSAIQSHIFGNQYWFREKGLFIPQAGYASGLGHAFLYAADSYPKSVTSNILVGTGALDQLRQELDAAERSGWSRALITWEGLSWLPEDDVRLLKEALCKHNIILLAYVREQSTLFQSAVLQRMGDLNALVDPPIFGNFDPKTLDLKHLDFFAIVHRWKRVFGDKLIPSIRVYAMKLLKENNIIIDFLDALDMDVDDRFCLQSARVNHSIDVLGAGILSIARLAGANDAGLANLSKALSRLAGQNRASAASFLDADEVAQLQSLFTESNRDLFREFSPSNMEAQAEYFPGPSLTLDAPTDSIDFDFLEALYQTMSLPPLDVWQGGILGPQRLARVISPSSVGWRGLEDTGVWSVGLKSEIRFLLPETHPLYGPRSLVLVLAGHYFEGNRATLVTSQHWKREVDLTRIELEIEIDEHVRENGVTIVLEHQMPQLSDAIGTLDPVRGLSYKLQFISYRFTWPDQDETSISGS